MTERKIVQLSTHPETKLELGVMYALCDDGSVWRMFLDGEGRWQQLPSIPQSDDASESAP